MVRLFELRLNEGFEFGALLTGFALGFKAGFLVVGRRLAFLRRRCAVFVVGIFLCFFLCVAQGHGWGFGIVFEVGDDVLDVDIVVPCRLLRSLALFLSGAIFFVF